MRHLLVPLVPLLALVGAASAQDRDLKQAEETARRDPVAAAAIYGRLVADAHHRHDLDLEERAAESLRDHLRGRKAYARLLEALDPEHAGAFVSAHLVAQRLLVLATAAGDTEYAEEAAAVLEKHANGKHRGKHAAAMLEYGRGLVALAKNESDQAAAHLGKALKSMTREGWAESALYAGTELAAARLAARDTDGAVAAMKQVASVFPPRGRRALFQFWRDLVGNRLAQAPPEVLAVYDDATKGYPGGGMAGGAGGRGGAGGPTMSKVGEAWNRLSKSKPFVTVKRTNNGFEFREAFDRRFKHEQPVQPGVKHFDDGGVTVSFWGNGVALAMVDLTGRKGQPGEGSQPGDLQLFYVLGRGETWGVDKRGAVTVK